MFDSNDGRITDWAVYPEEALEETAEWQRAHLPPEEWWHPDLVKELSTSTKEVRS